MKWSVRFEGGEQLAAMLRKLAFAVNKQILLAALKRGAEPMRDTAQTLAPRSSGMSHYGHLQDHIAIQSVNRVGATEGGRWADAGGAPWVAVGPRKDFFYGLYQEYGTKHHGAQPFMRPAFDSGAPAALPIISEELWRALRKQLPASFPTQVGYGNRLGMAA